MSQLSYLSQFNVGYIDQLHEAFLKDPDLVQPEWRGFFDGLAFAAEEKDGEQGFSPDAAAREYGCAAWIESVRAYGHVWANVNPLQASPNLPFPEGLARDVSYFAASLLGFQEPQPLDVIHKKLVQLYCGTLSCEPLVLTHDAERSWLRAKMEGPNPVLSAQRKLQISKRLIETEGFERFLHTRYVAQKRFSIEGCEALLVALDACLQAFSEHAVKRVVLGMAHRGRLAVLTQLLKRPLELIFTEFEGAYPVDLSKGEGDVKYHAGYASTVSLSNGKQIRVTLPSNPSHLEFVNPVVEGLARSKQDASHAFDCAPVLIHGDAAFAGQGVVFETLMMAKLKGYRTGGTLHLIVNNQVGFTTNPSDARSTPYATDLAKAIGALILHVNAEDPEAVWRAVELASHYRQEFKNDVVVDLIGYRKHGHNEGDEPAFTQPLLYKGIRARTSGPETYAAQLKESGILTSQVLEDWQKKQLEEMKAAQAHTKATNPPPDMSSCKSDTWKTYRHAGIEEMEQLVETGVAPQSLQTLAQQLNSVPKSFHLHPKLGRLFDGRKAAFQSGQGIDWGHAETLAYGTLLKEGYHVRLSGQDVQRGTFTHRHCVLTDGEDQKPWSPLTECGPGQFQAWNSHLSEAAVLGFEYGYALGSPQTLVVWEAQFGDFANGAQVAIDQFLASGESKWRRMSGVTLLLPHGYEGQAAEHSSARLERFLQLSARANWSVVYPTTPAQIFHVLRRQMKRPFRKPLIIMSPKSLLRHPLVISSVKDLEQGCFQPVLDDPGISDPSAVKHIRLMSGKIFYDAWNYRARELGGRSDVALIRLEELYPFPQRRLSEILSRYPQSAPVVWVQEEPQNMGAWSSVYQAWTYGLDAFGEKIGRPKIYYLGRTVAASPAVGSHHLHEVQQATIVQRVFV